MHVPAGEGVVLKEMEDMYQNVKTDIRDMEVQMRQTQKKLDEIELEKKDLTKSKNCVIFWIILIIK